MRYIQIRDTLDQVRVFHGHLAEYYGQLSDRAAQQRVKMLLDHISTRQRNLQLSMAAFEEGASRQVMDTWVDWSRCEEIIPTCEQTPFSPGLSVNGVVKLAMDVDRCLLHFYREVAAIAETETVREVFRNLIDMEEAELRMLAFGASQTMDI